MNLVLFEWKLIVRNKRLRQLFIVSMLVFFLVAYMQLASSVLLKEFFVLRECFLCLVFALPAANFAPLAFSINAAFIEKQLIAPVSIFKTLQAKYRLFCIISGVLFIMSLPSMLLGIKFIELVAAFLFSLGFVSGCLFWTSLSSYKPFDIKASHFYNFQGFDAANYFLPIVVIIIVLGITALFHWLFNETVTLVAMSLIGLGFIAANKIWLKRISKSFEKTKYHRLKCFREK